MDLKHSTGEKTSISARLRQLILYLAVPLCVMSAMVLLLFLVYSLQYAQISSNISTASRFNQNFKDEVDLKMYYFVTGSRNEIPWDEVETAEELATKLLGSTRDRESRRAVNSVLNLCENLKNCMSEIESTDGYDLRIHRLETNVYVITELIQDYMYTYLYHEAGALAALRERQNMWLITELVLTAGVMIVTIVFSLRRSFVITRSITRPIDELYGRVTGIGRGDLSPRPPVQAEDEKLRALGEGLEEMASRLNEQMELNRQEQVRLRSMELALVQAQINPHFLYNTLDAIMWLVETGKNEQAVEMVSSLSLYFRSFFSNGKDIITLREEALHVRSYLEIQQVRYKDILSYELHMDPALDSCLIPKMTLQPLVENAIYHGIKPKRGGGTVMISSAQEGEQIVLCVRDTGVGLTKDALETLRASLRTDEGTGFGVLASYKRLQLMFGEELDFRIDSEESRETEITIRIPRRLEETP
ncbi:MAG: sensor histidine kinase [Oscillospiraceae bacterium]|nr:sensor histidine kinase [Oscillospiraceae bacterium]